MTSNEIEVIYIQRDYILWMKLLVKAVKVVVGKSSGGLKKSVRVFVIIGRNVRNDKEWIKTGIMCLNGGIEADDESV